ncbi:hypothetical protein Tco_0923621 [Tanacetum coccineum]|uniref:Uncharacterized protein n=1 Tax=Tanacetum coccineum TaxID=301880 RepID=A0ABQ5D2X9_9ASTR
MGFSSPTFRAGTGVSVEKTGGDVPSLPFVMPENVNKPEGIKRLVYHDLYLGGKALVEKENVGFDLTKSDLCPSFIEDHAAKGVGLRVVDCHTNNHREDDFMPLETIQRFLGIIGSRSFSSSKGRPSIRRGGYVIILNVTWIAIEW